MTTPLITTPPIIVWLTNNLRLDDNAALSAAAARGQVIPVYLLDDSVARSGDVSLGGASKWWLRQALSALAKDLAKQNVKLIMRRGDAITVLLKLVQETSAQTIMASRRYEPACAAHDKALAANLQNRGIDIFFHDGFLLFEPARIQTGSGTPFKVYTPFARACFNAPPPAPPLAVPAKMQGIDTLDSDDVDTWNLVPRTAHWPKNLADAWDVRESAAHERLRTFAALDLRAYGRLRDRPDRDGTSRLSPYLHFGTISPRRIWHTIMQQSGGEKYLGEILWREFSWHLLAHIPDFTTQPLQKSFLTFPWRDDAAALSAWQRGQTGYPIVDAGMRQLWQSGWMHNRVRMITASFLIKDLLIDWRHGAKWFWDTLVDADLGSNTASWQWVAGCGADAAPYFRVFNPTLQGQKFDSNGDYVRHYVPELAKLDAKYIHEPWKAPVDILAKAGVTLGKNYPAPIVDHASARQRALNALKISKNGAGEGPDILDLFD